MEKNVCKMTDDSIFLIDIEKILKTKAGKKNINIFPVLSFRT